MLLSKLSSVAEVFMSCPFNLFLVAARVKVVVAGHSSQIT